MFCTKCGNQIKDGFKFCPKCGTPVYVENEAPQSEVKAQVEEVKEDASIKDSEAKKDVKGKDAAKPKTTSSSPKSSESSTSKHNDTPNPLIEEELDIEGVKEMAEKGNKTAMLRQAFRYEMGIGVEKDLEKSEILFRQVGGRNTLFAMEKSHNNCIVPDLYYDSPIHPSYEEDNDKGFYIKVLPVIKDIILEYEYKIELAKQDGILSEELSALYYNEFNKRVNYVKDLHPEFFFFNFDHIVEKNSISTTYEAIKENSSNRFSLKWIPSLYTFTDYIDGHIIESPSIFYINSSGTFSIEYETEEMKRQLINQFVFSVLLQLPIKKINLNFVDLAQKYEVDFIIKNLDKRLYNERPITTEEQLNTLLKRIENRRLEVTQKYGSYPDYCEKNKLIPLPYELIFLFDENYGEFNERLDLVGVYGHSVGVYIVLFNKCDNISLTGNTIRNPNKCELYTDSYSQNDILVQNGIVFHSNAIINSAYNKNTFSVILLNSGPAILQVVKEIKEICKLDLKEAKDLVNSTPSEIKSGLSKEEAEWISDSIYTVGGECIIQEENNTSSETCSTNMKRFDSTYERVIEGYGDFEVVVLPQPFRSSWKKWTEVLKIPDSKLRNLVYHNGFVLACFPSDIEASSYIDSLCERNRLSAAFRQVLNPANIYLLPCLRSRFITCNIVMGLCVPSSSINSFLQHIDDFLFYASILNLSQPIIDTIINTISGYKDCYAGVSTADWDGYKIDCISTDSPVYSSLVNGYVFHFWDDKKYSNVSSCLMTISEFESKLDKMSEEKWGEDNKYYHLVFRKDLYKDVPGAYITVRETKHYKSSLLNTKKLCSNKQNHKSYCDDDYIKECINFINTEADAKEEMQVHTLDFGSAAENRYETDFSAMVIPIGKAEAKDVDFRMDLVSHVHSFIIGQSGSGKSVFLHNIISGAMLKYAPEDLQLYLLDFKLGGVEFNRYQGAKHVKALLVDNSDPQVTLEILRELRNSMTERGKSLRGAGVNNIGEYNKMHQQDRMPHVLVVADECHEMFKADDSIPRQVRNEISDIVIKIAKEGRSQGVHLVFATQTLSGTEMSSEIINNVSDFYLLKCAQTDSERLVPNSSTITSELSTGQIYYHHVDEQVKFQAYYTDKEAAEKLMAAIVEKAKDHKSNGEFYFNGAQMFYLDEAVKEQIQNVKGKSPVAFLGKAIDISQKNLYIKLNEDFSENVLLLGLNDQEQVTRTTMNLFVSLMMSAKLKHKDIAFKVIDCLNNEEGEVHELIFDLENEGLCEIIERRQRSKFFKDLTQGVLDGTAEETILLILGQDRFRELKMDMELEDGNNAKSSDDDDMMSISDDFFGGGSSSSSSVKTYKEALNVILEKGPDYGVHTLLQIEKASNLLFEDYITPKVVFQKFKHLVMLKSDETAGVTLHLNDDIRLEKLSSDWERLRAYYYAEESDSYTLFTPYMLSKSKDIINLLKTI